MPHPHSPLRLRRPSAGEVLVVTLAAAALFAVALMVVAFVGLVGLGLGLVIAALVAWHQGRRALSRGWSSVKARFPGARRVPAPRPPSAGV